MGAIMQIALISCVKFLPEDRVTASPTALAFAPSEDPFVVEHGGFYRRWLSMFENLDELKSLVATLEATTQDKWVPVWRDAGRQHEDAGDALAGAGEKDRARTEYLLAKTYYAIGRFPGEITSLKGEVSADCARAYRKACRDLDPPLQVVEWPARGALSGRISGRPAPTRRSPPC